MKMAELLQKRAALLTEARGHLDRGDLEKWENMQKDLDALDTQINALKKQEEAEEAASKIAGRAFEPKPGEKKDEYSELFYNACRTGDFSKVRALSTTPDTAGGFLQAPATLEAAIREILMANVAMRKLATVIKATVDRKVPIATAFGAAAWIDEDGSYGVTDDTFGSVTLGSYKVGRIIKVSEELLMDSAFNLEAFVAKSLARSIGEVEETAFVTGDGSGKPTGVMNGISVGVTTTSNSAITADEVLDLFYSLKVGYRGKATFLMNDATEKYLRKLKNGTTGDYMWQPGLTSEQPNKLLGRPVANSDSVDTIAATKNVIVFGDFSNYMIKDTAGMEIQVLRELYAANGQVGFKGHLRTDGARVVDEAFKSLKMKA